MPEQKDLEQLDVICFGIQFFENGKWGPLLDLAPYLHDVLKETMRHSSFRFVMYGQLGPPGLVPQPGEPEHENRLTGAAAKTAISS